MKPKYLQTAVAVMANNPGFQKLAYVGVTMAMTSGSAFAQASTKSTLTNIFVWLYSLVGVIGGITLLVQIINAKAGNFLGTQDPRKSIINSLIYVALAFGVVAIIQAVKDWVAGSGSGIGTL